MDNYVQIRLLSDPEFGPSLLMNALFTKFHHALVELGPGRVGVSFPQAEKSLGDTIRLHGPGDDLQRLTGMDWLRGLKDYITMTPISPVPNHCRTFRLVSRVQAKSSSARLYRRSVKKGWLTAEEARVKMADSREQRVNLPFVQITSQSSGQKFRLFIRQGKLLDFPMYGSFSAYGLSNAATIPWF